MKKYWTGIGGQILVGLKRLFRDKVALFFTFLFPLLFLFVFGSIFNNNSAKFDIAILNNSQTEFAKQFAENAKKDESGVFKIKEVKDMDDAKEKLKRSEIDGLIELPENFGEVSGEGQTARPSGTVNVLYAKGSDQTGSTLSAVFSQIIDGINKQMGHPEAPLNVSAQAVGDSRLSNFDYTFTGLLAFSLMSMGVFGLASQMPAEKQRGNYRRLRAAPFTSGQLIIATSVVYTLVSLISAAMMIIVGMLVFKFTIRGDWLLFVSFMTLSAAMMVGIGLMIGAWAKNENQSAPLSNLISFPMMFLSGAFFPAFLFPEWLKSISQFVPMTSVVDGFRLITTENASLTEVLPQIGIVTAFLVVIYALAIKLFRWE